MHREITEPLKQIIDLAAQCKKLESKINRPDMEGILGREQYILTLLSHEKTNGGDIDRNLQGIVVRLSSSRPDFLPIGMSVQQLERYSKSTDSKSERMESQLSLAKLLQVKDLFKIETDVFNDDNVKAIKKYFRETK